MLEITRYALILKNIEDNKEEIFFVAKHLTTNHKIEGENGFVKKMELTQFEEFENMLSEGTFSYEEATNAVKYILEYNPDEDSNPGFRFFSNFLTKQNNVEVASKLKIEPLHITL